MSKMAEYPFNEYRLYVVLHKGEGRRVANLVKPGNTHRTTISYARYLMSVHLGRILGKEEHVDHINNDKLDDRVENFQLLSLSENTKKSSRGQTYFDFSCPICKKDFKLSAQDSHRINPACSRKCGYEKMKLKRKLKANN